MLYLSNFMIYHYGYLFVAWSLATEEQFYSIWPWIEKFLQGPWFWGVFTLILGFNIALNVGWADWAYAPFYSGGIYPNLMFTPILIGVLLAHVMHHPRGYDWLMRPLRSAWAPLVLLLGTTVFFFAWPGRIDGWSRLAMQGLMTLLLASLVLPRPFIGSGAANSFPVRRVGVVSYAIYLLHLPVSAAIHRVAWSQGWEGDLPWYLSLPAAMIGTYLVAEVSFWCYERPFLKLKQYFKRVEHITPTDPCPAADLAEDSQAAPARAA